MNSNKKFNDDLGGEEWWISKQSNWTGSFRQEGGWCAGNPKITSFQDESGGHFESTEL